MHTLLYILLLGARPPAGLAGGPAPGVRISGVVSDDSGGYVAGASVSLFSEERVVQVKSDDSGHFEFSGVSPGTFEAEVSFPGFRTETLNSVEVADRDIEGISVTLHVGTWSGPCVIGLKESDTTVYEKRTDEANLRGMILNNEGKPLSNATAVISGAGQTRVASSTDRGEFVFAGLEPGKYTLNVSRDGYDSGIRKLWITRQNLTRVKFILITRNPCGQPPAQNGVR